MAMNAKPKGKGFAAMDKGRLKEVSREAGKKSQASGKGFRWGPLEARAQSKRGGKARWKGHIKV